MTWHPFSLSASALHDHLDEAVDATFADLTGQFMLMPRGDAFVTYEAFHAGYEALRTKTANFANVTETALWKAIRTDSRAFLALRAVLGVSPPEWAELASEELVTDVPQQAARTMDQRVKRDPAYFSGGLTLITRGRIDALLKSASILQ